MSDELTRLVFSIQHFCIHDGNGIRSTVFLCGCPLKCEWCHNPEGQSCSPKNWADGSSVGKYMTVSEVLDEVEGDAIFFEESGGGITLSGGEPMMQPDFTYALLKEAKSRGLHTAIETCGYAPTEDYMKILPYADEFLWDYKLYDSGLHMKYTGRDNKLIIENLRRVHGAGAGIKLRLPIIPDVNDTEKHFLAIEALKKELPNLREAEVMPYHKLGISKAARLGCEQREFRVPEKAEIDNWKKRIEK